MTDVLPSNWKNVLVVTTLAVVALAAATADTSASVATPAPWRRTAEGHACGVPMKVAGGGAGGEGGRGGDGDGGGGRGGGGLGGGLSGGGLGGLGGLGGGRAGNGGGRGGRGGRGGFGDGGGDSDVTCVNNARAMRVETSARRMVYLPASRVLILTHGTIRCLARQCMLAPMR